MQSLGYGKSKYLERFMRLKEETGSKYFRILEDRILLEILPKEEIKTASGLIIVDDPNQKGTADEFRPTIAVVLYLGEAFEAPEKESDKPLPNLKQGDLLLVAPFGLRYYSEFPGLNDYTRNTIAFTRPSEAHLVLPAPSSLERVSAILNK